MSIREYVSRLPALARKEGFLAAMHDDPRCPYATGSNEAVGWWAGLIEWQCGQGGPVELSGAPIVTEGGGEDEGKSKGMRNFAGGVS